MLGLRKRKGATTKLNYYLPGDLLLKELIGE
jgi:hypothetical protein